MIIATIIALVILLALTIFQIALIFGAPLGKFAWGGQHTVLPRKLRIGSVTSILIYVLFAVFLISKATDWHIIANENIVNAGLWATTLYLIIGVFMNSISRSKPERYTMVPVTLVLTICFYIVASS